MSQQQRARLVRDRHGRKLGWLYPDRTFLRYIGGGADDPPPSDPKPDPDPDDLGEAGKKALAQERQARKEAEKAAKAAEKERDDIKSRLEKLEADAMSEQEKAIEKARKEAADEARQQERERFSTLLVEKEAKVVAATKLADADDIRLLDLSSFKVNDDGSIEGDVSKAVDDLLESKPHLAAKGQKPTGSADQGARPTKTADPDVKPGIGRLQNAYAESGKT